MELVRTFVSQQIFMLVRRGLAIGALAVLCRSLLSKSIQMSLHVNPDRDEVRQAALARLLLALGQSAAK
jgi:hypothetical protein